MAGEYIGQQELLAAHGCLQRLGFSNLPTQAALKQAAQFASVAAAGEYIVNVRTQDVWQTIESEDGDPTGGTCKHVGNLLTSYARGAGGDTAFGVRRVSLERPFTSSDVASQVSAGDRFVLLKGTWGSSKSEALVEHFRDRAEAPAAGRLR